MKLKKVNSINNGGRNAAVCNKAAVPLQQKMKTRVTVRMGQRQRERRSEKDDTLKIGFFQLFTG